MDRLVPLSWPTEADDSFKVVANRYFLLCLTLAWGVICSPTLAYTADERIALLLTGSACPQSYATLEQNLIQIPGVMRINLHTVPDHVLIDADPAVIDADLLVKRSNDLLEAHTPCRAALMRSCISADRRTTIGRATQETPPILQFGQ